MSVEPTRAKVDLSTLRVIRDGGPTDADREFRAELFRRIGAVTVSASAVEAAMKRLVLVLKEERVAGFSVVDRTWSDLHKMLRDECTGADARRLELAKILDWGEHAQVKRRRDDVVHAYWWAFDGCGVRRARFHRKKEGACILAAMADLDDAIDKLSTYADKLDVLLGEDWPIATLPAT
jgi:hypothetical protein